MLAVATALLAPAVAPDRAAAQEEVLQEENTRLQAENDRLRAELEALKKEAAGASAEAREAADDAASPVTSRTRSDVTQEAETAVAEYVPGTRVTLSIARDDAGGIRRVSTPWYRTVPDTGLLPLREFIQFRAVPAHGGRPEQVWLALNRQGAAAPLGADVDADLQADTWSGKAPVVDQKISRRRRVGRQNALPQRRDETTLFALPSGALQKIAISERATLDAGPVHFEFTDEHVAAASAMTARLAKEERQ